MAYNDNQNEYPLPAGSDGSKRSAELLPRYFRTDANKKFLGSTLDQFNSSGVVEKINAFAGSRVAKAVGIDDAYLPDINADRQNYQLDPVLVYKDSLDNVEVYRDYNDYIGQVKSFRGTVDNHSLLNSQEFYAWDPHICFDKFTNFREYYWLPNGPQEVPVRGQTKEVISTYQVKTVDQDDNVTYVFTPNGLTNNPQIKLFRGQTYRFEIDCAGHPISIAINRSKLANVDPDDSSLVTALYEEGVTLFPEDTDTLVDRADFIAPGFIEKGVLEFTVPENAPDTLYYISQYDINTSGQFTVFNIEESSFIDVESEIVGKKTYTTGDGWEFSNGMKVYFTGDVKPESYATGLYYVEGVGREIQLIPVNDLEVPAIFTQDTLVPFDSQGFDRVPFSDALSFAGSKDYIVMNRGDASRNAWARYNRWFHKTVIDKSAELNNQNSLEVSEEFRAKRPIIEFESGLRLYNHGIKAKQNVDVVDTFTKDVFSIIEGSAGYNVDGIDLVDGMRVLFTADPDSFVNGKIYQVNFITHNNSYQISLTETKDSDPQLDETILVKTGNVNAGRMYWYNGTEWKLSQDKTGLNQAPHFDLFDQAGNSIGNEEIYPTNNFTGNKVFNYKVGTGTNDSELGFPLSYKNITNIGDIVFDYSLLNQTYEYDNNNTTQTVASDTLYLKRYINGDGRFNYVNSWTKANIKSRQFVIRKYTGQDTVNNFAIDVYNNSALLNDIEVKVYVNNKLKKENVDYQLVNINKTRFVVLNQDIDTSDIVVLKTHSSTLKNANGYYEMAHNFERNPLNNNIGEFTLGQVNDHVEGLVAEIKNYSGEQPGRNNLRDLGDVKAFGRKFVQHTGLVNLALYHLTDKDANIVKSLRFAKNEYVKFKRAFLKLADETGFHGPTKKHVDHLLNELNKDKTTNMPFANSDMIGVGAAKRLEYTILDFRNTYYALSAPFNLNTIGLKAVNVYVNGEQLIYGRDYNFTDTGFVNIISTLANGDLLEIYEYETSEGSYIPPTPTKLGLYPSFYPEKFLDTSYQTQYDSNGVAIPDTGAKNVIRGHDGSIIVAYDDYRDDLLIELEKRIFNNIKVAYNEDIFDIANYIEGNYRDTKLSKTSLDKVMIQDFVNWLKLTNNNDYTDNSFITQGLPFTYNYSKTVSPTGKKLPGFWRAVYKQAFDTDRPHTHPWEMLGFSKVPSWWTDVYGPAPYTKDNLILWKDLETGTIREPGQPVRRNKKYVRPLLTKHIPVNEFGQLISPLESGFAKEFSYSTSRNLKFKFGDEAPAETAWRRSSEYPFALITALVLNRPTEVFGLAFDRSRITRNLTGNIVYSKTNKSLRLQDLVFPKTVVNRQNIFTAGLVNYIADYLTTNLNTRYETYIEQVTNLKNQLGFKLGGFADKEKLKLVLDSRTPLNQGNVFVPFENYNIVMRSSSTLDLVSYSGVIVEKTGSGYAIRGYDNQDPFFTYFAAIESDNDPLVNVGGISDSFIEWNENSNLVAGKIVRYQSSYYRVTTNHNTGESFDPTKFAKLPSLPVVGGAQAYFRRRFSNTSATLNYGTVLETPQEVVNFLLGYEKYLIAQGFKFDYFNRETESIENFNLLSKEFLFWTTQNWAAGTTISLSPAANALIFERPFYVVDDIVEGFYEYNILNVDGKLVNRSYANIARDNTNTFGISISSSDDGIYFAKLPLVQKEHAVLIDNTTVFNDTIYDLEPGYRQERIKVVGYRTDGWNGSLNIPGFVYDQAKVSDWQEWKDYSIGELVKFKEFYYSAKVAHTGQKDFVADLWNKLPERPTSALKPNWDYRAAQFTDFYDLDTDNFDSEQQRLAQHLIGYQKRQYLENIIQDDVSQYKFYQGMIQDKGTKNVLTKLFDKLGSANQDSLNFYEEWAIRTGQYGAVDTVDEAEYQLDESKFRIEPQLIELVNTVDQARTDLIFQYPLKDVYVTSKNYNHKPLPVKWSNEEYSKTAGYVKLDQINFIAKTLSDILALDINSVKIGHYIWVPQFKQTWDILKHIQSPVRITKIVKTNTGFTATFNKNIPFAKGEIVGINNVNDEVNGFWVATKVVLNTVEFVSNIPISDDEIDLSDSTLGIVTQLNSRKFATISDVNEKLVTYDVESGDRIWVDDNGTGKFEVFDNNEIFDLQQEITNPELTTDGNFAESIDVNPNNTILVVGQSGLGINGGVRIYSRNSDAQTYTLLQTITPPGIVSQGLEIITNTNPVTISTPSNHDLQTGQQIKITSATGLTELNNNFYYVEVLSDVTIGLYTDKNRTIPVDGTAYGVHDFGTGLISSGVLYNQDAGFGTSVSLSSDGVYLYVGAPYASNVKSKYRGEIEDLIIAGSNISAKDIVSDRGVYYVATRDVSFADLSTINLDTQDWNVLNIIEATSDGYESGDPEFVGYTNQGVVHVYKKQFNGTYELQQTMLSPYPQANEYFGFSLKNAIDSSYTYKLFARGTGNNGRIYLLKSFADRNNYIGSAKSTNYRGTWNSTKSYIAGEIVYYEGVLYAAQVKVFSGGSTPATPTWEVVDSYIDYVGYIPNFGDVLIEDSDSVGLGNAVQIGRSFDISKTGDVIALTGYVPADNELKVSIYKTQESRYIYSQSLEYTDAGEGFAYGIAVNDAGTMIAVSSILNDDTGVDNGKVEIFNQVNGEFILAQTLYSPKREKNELFGWKLDFSNNRLAVMSINGDNEAITIFDGNTTYFDNGATNVVDLTKDNGQVYVFENINGVLVYAEKMRYARQVDDARDPTMILSNNHILLALPGTNAFAGVTGIIVDFTSDKNKRSWITNSVAVDYVDNDKMNGVFLYDKTTQDLISYLDYIDPIHGKIPGPAEQELNYKLYYDPAVYNIGSTNTGFGSPWADMYVGKMWWDMSTAKWYNPHQGNTEYRSNNWNKLVPGFDIDVYEWVESQYLPSEWDDLADTVEGSAEGVSGTSKYSDDSYSVANIYDPVSGTFKPRYYFWVKNKKTKIPERKLSCEEVANLIKDPAGQGYRFIALLGNDRFAIHNSLSLIKDKDTILHFDFEIGNELNNNIHSEYQLLTEGLSDSKPNTDITLKWIDSVVGYDRKGNQLPDINVPLARRYGILNYPNQTMFVNRTEALKQIIERVNFVLSQNLIVDDFDISPLFKADPSPSKFSREWDVTIEGENLLRFVGVAKLQTATLQPVIVNGKITDVIITNPGRGYVDSNYTSGQRLGPNVTIRGTGTGAKLQTYINNLGQITSVKVLNQGKNYSDNATLTVRRFSVLVQNDSSIGGFWSVYTWDTSTKSWFRNYAQSYDTSLYWNYIDWYATGYSDLTPVNYLVTGSYELEGLNDKVGDVVKIENIGTGGWLLLKKIDNQEQVDYTVNYQTIGRENGTIEFSRLLYSDIRTGYDNQVFDAVLYDREPSNEIRIIMETLRDNIFVDQLEVEWNKLFFASVRYAMSEQVNIDWIFKTSFVKAKHNVGELDQRITFRNDNLSNYQDYVNEVKPYSTKVREYISAYEKVDTAANSVTDFDLPPRYDSTLARIIPESVKVIDSELTNLNTFVVTYPQKHWYDNVGFEITDIVIYDSGNGYTDAPNVTISGGGGPTLTGRAILGAAGVVDIDVNYNNVRYISAPTVTFDGGIEGDGTHAKAYVRLGNAKTRSTHMLMKFDRTSGNYLILNLDETETFTGTGSKTEFDLKWPIDTRRSKIKVYVDGVESLSSEFTPSNTLDTSKGYDRYKGRITFVDDPANRSTVIIEYSKAASMLHAADRINHFYNPTTGMLGKDLGQLMDGVDYGGVQIDTIDFGNKQGFESGGFGIAPFDSFDTAYEDEIFILDGSTAFVELSGPLEAGQDYNVYRAKVDANGAIYNQIRLDDPNYDGSSVLTNTNAIMATLVGDGITNVFVIDNDTIPTEAGDVIIIRKSTSDGSFTPAGAVFDVELSGGSLPGYTTATGIEAGDIIVDGDGFVTPTTSRGPEEQVPGQVVDTLDIRVFNRVSNGQGMITVHNYRTDGETNEWSIDALPQAQSSVIVKLDNQLLSPSLYTIDYENNKITIDDSSLIDPNQNLNIVIIGNNGDDLIDSETFISDGSTTIFPTVIDYKTTYTSFITVNGIVQTYQATLVDLDGKLGIEFGAAPMSGDIITYTIYDTTEQSYSQLIIDETFAADGVLTQHKFDTETNPTPLPFNQKPIGPRVLVQTGNFFLNSGYNIKYTMSSARTYDIQGWQFDDPTTLYQGDIVVYINGEFVDSKNYFYDRVNARVQITNFQTGLPGDTLEIFVIRDSDYYFIDTVVTLTNATGTADYLSGEEIEFALTDDSTVVNAVVDEFTRTGSTVTIKLRGYVRELSRLAGIDNTPETVGILTDSSQVTISNVKVVESNNLTFATAPVLGITTKIYVFSNHDVNQFDRISYDVYFKTSLAPIGTQDYLDKNLLSKGVIRLRQPAVNANYVWVLKNGELLSANVDYSVTTDLTAVQLAQKVGPRDKVEVLQFAAPISKPKYGFRIFKDMLNRYHYKRLNKDNEYELAAPLNWYDTNILISDATGLPSPNRVTSQPGIIWINGERIEYYVKDGNALKQLRRGTLGTGAPLQHAQYSKVSGQGPEENIPYQDQTLTTRFTGSPTLDLQLVGDGSTTVHLTRYDLTIYNDIKVFVNNEEVTDFTIEDKTDIVFGASVVPPVNSIINITSQGVNKFLLDFDLWSQAAAYITKTGTSMTLEEVAADTIEVFVAGRRLRNHPIDVFDATVDQDSTEADVTVPAEYSVDADNILTLTDTPAEGQHVLVVRKIGKTWNDPNTSLSDSNNQIAKFIRDKTISLPR